MPNVARHARRSIEQPIEWKAPERISPRALTRGLPQIPLPWFDIVPFVSFAAMI